jgi:hypothetical protein
MVYFLIKEGWEAMEEGRGNAEEHEHSVSKSK